MKPETNMLAALVRLAVLQREVVDQLAIEDAVNHLENTDQSRRLTDVAAHLGFDAPKWIPAPDPALVPALALSPVGKWTILLGKNLQDEWICTPSDGSSTEEILADTTGWRFAMLRMRPAFALGRSPVFALIKNEMLRHVRLLIESTLGGVVIGLLGLLISFYSMQVYNRVIPTNSLQTLWVLSLGVLIALGLEWLARNARSGLYERLIDEVDQRLARSVYLRLLSLRLDQLPPSVGTLAAQMRGYETVRAFLTQGTSTLLTDAPFAFLFLICIGWIGGVLAIIPLGFFVIAIAAGLAMRRPLEEAGRIGARASNKKMGLLVETVEGAETLKSGQGGWRMLGRWLSNTEQARSSELKSRRLSEHFQHLMLNFQQFSYVLIVATGAWMVSKGELTMGGLVACTILSGRVLNPISLVANQILQWSNAKAALEGLDQIWRLEDDHHGMEPVLLEEIRGYYRCNGVEVRYGNRLALAIPAIEIHPGERIGIVGPVGAGKTTLLRTLSGMYKPHAGQVFLDDIDLAQIAKPALSKSVAYLQQEGRLFAGTLRENLILGLVDPGDAAILDAAHESGLFRAVIATHPRGLQQEIYEGGSGLSGGQRQLVNLTRVLLRRPKIWLLDEPTAALDGNNERHVIDLLRQAIKPGETLVLVTHKPELLQLVDRLIVVADQRIVADGPVAQILARLQAPASNPLQEASV